MHFEARTVRKAINKAFLKEPVERGTFDQFKKALGKLLTGIEQANEAGEREEHFKNLLPPFFKAVGFEDYKINTSSNVDLAIYTGGKTKDPLGVMIEVKRPSNKSEMISSDRLNRKAMHEAVLYYLEQRIAENNSDLKHVIITDMTHWYIFDAQEFERCFYRPSTLRKAYQEWKENRKVSSNTDFMYNEIASFINDSDASISGISLPLEPVRKLLNGDKGSEYEKRLIPLYKFFSPIHLLKEPFANDSNNLNKEFYRELLYILGLEETKEGSTRYIRRAEKENRQSGSVIENTIQILDAEDRLSSLEKPRSHYGSNRDEQLFSVAMELSITWMNRILFLKLLEAQLYRYHSTDNLFKFLSFDTIDSLDELNKLFFQVLARKEKDRSADINEKFGHIPFLNSSLFDVSDLEHQTVTISNLDDHAEIPVYGKSVLNDLRGKPLNTLDYLFRFLDAYDFSAEGSEEIREERKSLINASVLGLIFEKINGYKDGSFYTPGFITEYMARETLQKAVIDAFNKKYDWSCESLDDVEADIHRDRIPYKEANAVINELKICDPAVGSGHFLVSCLNELIAIKSKLRILCDTDMKVLREVEVTVENDELIVSSEDGLFQYKVSHTWQGRNKLKDRKVSPDKERVQKALFHEKRYLIENCLFGVDINPNSVKICRLRLWIELLKRAYYTEESNFMELEVLPNIDINIKDGNSLVSRFELDSDLNSVFKNSDYTLDDYKDAVRNYKETGDRDEKKRLKVYIDDVKKNFEVGLRDLHPERKKLKVKEAKLVELTTQFDMFGDEIEGEAGSRKVRIKMAEQELEKQKEKVEDLESGAFYNQAFEWRFEFPEVLDGEGRFTGFDVVIGNPPYVRQEQFKELKPYLKDRYTVYQGTADLYSYFIELGMNLLAEGGHFQYIVANKWMRANYGQPLREWLQQEVEIKAIYDFGDLPVFEEATTYPCLLQLQKSTPTSLFIAAEIETLDFDLLDKYLVENRFESDQTKLQTNGWALIDEKAQKLLTKLKRKGIPLGEYVNGKFYYGIKTGLNKVFVIDKELREKLISEDPKSRDIIKPFLAGRNIKRYQVPKTKNYLIFTRRGIDINKYPAILNYLLKYKDQLEPRPKDVPSSDWDGRKPGSYEWYEIQDTIDYYEEFEKQKIIWAEIATHSQFTLDADNLYLDTTGFMMQSKSKSLLGILNSKLWTFMFSSISSEIRGGFYRWKRQYMEVMPLPESFEENEELESLVDQVLAAKKQNSETDTTELESEIDRLVYELYGLSEEEIRVVEGSTT